MAGRNVAQLIWAAATPMEMEAVASGLGISFPMPEPGAHRRALWQGRECFFLLTGVGPVLAAFHFGLFLGRMQHIFGHPDAGQPLPAVINAGIAGSFCLRTAPAGSLVLADAEAWPEYGVATASGVEAAPLGIPLLARSGGEETIWDRLPLNPDEAFSAMGLSRPEACVSGPSLTVAGVSGDAARAALLRRRYAPLTENMEGFPLALACRCRHMPFVEVRAVSNAVGERDKAAWDIAGALRALERGIKTVSF